MTKFTEYNLGEILSLDRRPIELLPNEQYTEIGIRSFGKGIFHKEPRTGFEIGDKKLYKICEDDFIFQVTFAWEGAIAIASKNENDVYGSTRFPTFRVNTEICFAPYLLYYFQTHRGLFQIGNISPGSAGRNRVLSIKRIPEVIVPLPPVKRQEEIVRYVESLANYMDKARSVRRLASKETEGIFVSALNQIWSNTIGWNEAPIGKIARTVSGQVDPKVEPYASLPHINGQSIEKNTGRLIDNYVTAAEDGVISGKYHFPPDTILYSKIRPYLRKATQVPFEGICSADIYAFDDFNDDILPRFFMYSVIAPPFSEYADSVSGRTRIPKLNQNQMLRYTLKYPGYSRQQEIVTYLDDLRERITDLRKLQVVSGYELDALLPSVLDKVYWGEL